MLRCVSVAIDYLRAFIDWCAWMANPAVWVVTGGAVLLLGAVVVVARARFHARWSGPQYRRSN